MFQKYICSLIIQIFLLLAKKNLAQHDFFKDSIYDELAKANVVYKNRQSTFNTDNYSSSIFGRFSNKMISKVSEQDDEKPTGCGITPERCPDNKYRSYDGSCNNLKNPTWGTPNTPYSRLLPANYADGIKEPPLAKSGRPLPLARSVSLLFYPDVPIEDNLFTLNIMQYGQIITHDLSMTAGSTQTQHYKTKCCSEDGKLLALSNISKYCYPMIIPHDDPAHSHDNTRCMSFDRTVTNRDRNCINGSGPAEQLTSVNHYLDLSFVYGNDDETNHQLRDFKGGRLRADTRKGQQWPPRAVNASASCRLVNPKDACYFAGDTRINQNPQLALLHVILLREHNRIADLLSRFNPHWDDEKLFQEARKINIGQHQHITYYEWLPYLVGKNHALRMGLTWKTDGFINDYNEKVDATILNEQSTGALRHFHSLIAGRLHLITENRYSQGTIRFSDVLRRPQILEEKNTLDELIRGLTTQPQSASDQFHDSEVTQFLFREDHEKFGVDLKAFDIQRGRDHGLRSYNDYREMWKLPRAKKFEDFLDYISEQNYLPGFSVKTPQNPPNKISKSDGDENIQNLAKLYEHPDDVDLTVGASLERNLPGALFGPTFLYIVTEQFYRTRVGDRFWFENDSPNGFKIDQLREIRKTSISRLLCDNGHNINNMQPRGFELQSASNPLVPCHSLPKMDLSLWKEEQQEKQYNKYASLRQNVFFFK